MLQSNLVRAMMYPYCFYHMMDDKRTKPIPFLHVKRVEYESPCEYSG